MTRRANVVTRWLFDILMMVVAYLGLRYVFDWPAPYSWMPAILFGVAVSLLVDNAAMKAQAVRFQERRAAYLSMLAAAEAALQAVHSFLVVKPLPERADLGQQIAREALKNQIRDAVKECMTFLQEHAAEEKKIGR